MLLAIVGCQHRYLFGRISQQSHVHEQGYDVLSLCEILVKERTWLRLPNSVEVRNIDHLVVINKARVGC